MTLLVKVQAHRGGALNEEGDIRVEMGYLKEQKEVTWDISQRRNGARNRGIPRKGKDLAREKVETSWESV